MNSIGYKVEVRDLARGRWHIILPALGINAEHLRNHHMRCPGCGGTDRFRWDDKDGSGSFYCGGGGEPVYGDGFALLSHVHGWDFKTCAEQVRSVLGVESGAMSALGGKQNNVVPLPKKKPTNDHFKRLWAGAYDPDVTGNSKHFVAGQEYAQLKGIEHQYGARRGFASGSLIGQNTDCVIVPNHDLDGNLTGVECIGIPDENGKTPKQSFGKKGLLILGNDLDPDVPIILLEGWASAVSWVFHIKKGNACAAVYFGKGSGRKRLADVKQHYPSHVVLLGEEQDD
jgi:phage/plasmid primase-like uncharacterized protein